MTDYTKDLPPEVRAAYQASCEGMTPTGMRWAFGIVQMPEDGDSEDADEFNPQTDAGRMARKLSLDAMRDWEGIHNAHWSSMADPTTDKRAAFLRSAQHAKSVLQKVDADYAAALDAIEQRSEHVAKVLEGARRPPTGHGDALIDAETRAAIRATVKPDEIAALVAANPRAVATLPDGLAHALVGETHARHAVRAHLQAVEPAAYAESKELRRAMKVAEMAHGELNKRARKMIDFRAAEAMGKHANWNPQQVAA